MKQLKTVLLLCGLALFLSACGVPIDTSAHTIDSSKIPSILQSPVPGPAQPAGRVHGDHEVTVYFLLDNLLHPVSRYETGGLTSAEISDALNFLNIGPDGNEIKSGITTALTETSVDQVTLSGIDSKTGVATIQLSSEFVNTSFIGTALYQAFGQIVYTVTGFGIKGLVFSFDGATFPAFLPDGETTTLPVNRGNYSSIAESP